MRPARAQEPPADVTPAASDRGRAVSAAGAGVRRGFETLDPGRGTLKRGAGASQRGSATLRRSGPQLQRSLPPLRHRGAQLRRSSPPLRQSAAQLRRSCAPLRRSAPPLRRSGSPLRRSAATVRQSMFSPDPRKNRLPRHGGRRGRSPAVSPGPVVGPARRGVGTVQRRSHSLPTGEAW